MPASHQAPPISPIAASLLTSSEDQAKTSADSHAEKTEATEKVSGDVNIDYGFERFNAHSEYTEVKKGKFSAINPFDRNEAVKTDTQEKVISPPSPEATQKSEQSAPKTTANPQATNTPEQKTQATSKETFELADTERFNRAKKEIMAEVEKIFPMNDQEYSHLENSIDEQLSLLIKKGKPNDVQKFKEDLKNGLPTLRQELGNAASMEHQQAKTAHQQEQKQKHKHETKER